MVSSFRCRCGRVVNDQRNYLCRTQRRHRSTVCRSPPSFSCGERPTFTPFTSAPRKAEDEAVPRQRTRRAVFEDSKSMTRR